MKVVISKCEKVERRVLAVEEQEIFLGYLARTKRESVKWVDYDGKILKCVIVFSPFHSHFGMHSKVRMERRKDNEEKIISYFIYGLFYFCFCP
jgi:hypothetical protein